MRDNEFALMGGQYLSWFLALPQDGTPVYNAGIQGGTRDTLLKLVTNMIQVTESARGCSYQLRKEVHKKRPPPPFGCAIVAVLATLSTLNCAAPGTETKRSKREPTRSPCFPR